MSKMKSLTSKVMIAMFALFPIAAMAGTGGGEFDEIWLTLSDWVEGTLGRIIAAGIVVVGIVAGIVKQSLMAFAIGIGGGMGLYNTPSIIEEILTAALPVVGA